MREIVTSTAVWLRKITTVFIHLFGLVSCQYLFSHSIYFLTTRGKYIFGVSEMVPNSKQICALLIGMNKSGGIRGLKVMILNFILKSLTGKAV